MNWNKKGGKTTGKSSGVLLLLTCLLLLTLLNQVALADGCTPTPDSPICAVVDKSSYTAGQTVTIIVEQMHVGTPADTMSYGIILTTPELACINCPVEYGSITLTYEHGTIWAGTTTMVLPSTLNPGNYELYVVGMGNSVYAGPIQVAVTGQAPVPEAPSALLLLIPALLVGIYVLRRKRSVD